MNEIKGIKLIIHNASNVNIPDDPSYPYRLDANLRPPEFMMMAFIGMYGGSEIIQVRGKTIKVLEQFSKENGLESHPRLRELKIWNPESGEISKHIEN